MRSRREGRRGQSITLDYALALAIGFLLVTGLIIAGGEFVSDQRDRATRSELNVIGQQIANDVAAADRLIQAIEGDGNVSIRREIPGDVARSTYRIEVVAEENASLRLDSVSSDVEVTVALTNQTHVVPSNVTGGVVVVNHTDAGEIRVEEGDRYA